MESRVTTALVLETNNLRGGAAPVARSLARLLLHLRRQTRPLTKLDEVVITHDGLDDAEQARLVTAAGASLRFLRLPPGCDYYEAKNRGFAATGAAVVAFADADCWPDSEWLERLLAPFAEPATAAVAGRTCYRDGLLGAAATNIDFLYFASPLGAGCTRNFYANNVAFRRAVFPGFPVEPGIYRGQCQILGLRLQAAGVKVRFEPDARTVHRFPDSVRELLRLRLLRGSDAVEVAPYLADAYLPLGLRALGRPLAVLGVRVGYSLRAAWPSLARMAVVVAISAVDVVGALAGAPATDALSYHEDVDRLAA